MTCLLVRVSRTTKCINTHDSAIIAFNEVGVPSKKGDINERLDTLCFALHQQSGLSDHECLVSGLDASRAMLDPLHTFGSFLYTLQTSSSEEDLLRCLLLMARFCLVTFTKLVADSNDYSEYTVKWEDWLNLRTELDRFYDDYRTFSRYLKREFNEVTHRDQRARLQEDLEDLLAEARALESLLRDVVQVNVGSQSLQASRASIEDGKRNKLRKITAFCQVQAMMAIPV